MSHDDRLFLMNFQDEMKLLSERCKLASTRGLNDLHETFFDTDDGLFAYLCRLTFTGFDEIRAVLPNWAPEEIRRQSTGEFSDHEMLLDATWFWRTVRSHYERLIPTAR